MGKGPTHEPNGNRRGYESQGPRHVRLDYALLGSDAFRALSPTAVKVYLGLLHIHNGSNNGRIAMSAQRAGEFVGKGKSTGGRALRELTAKGFIVCTRPASFGTGGRLSQEWRLTAHPVQRPQHSGAKRKMQVHSQATRDFMKWRPPAKPTRGKQKLVPPMAPVSATGGTQRPRLRVVEG